MPARKKGPASPVKFTGDVEEDFKKLFRCFLSGLYGAWPDLVVDEDAVYKRLRKIYWKRFKDRHEAGALDLQTLIDQSVGMGVLSGKVQVRDTGSETGVFDSGYIDWARDAFGFEYDPANNPPTAPKSMQAAAGSGCSICATE